MVLDVTYITAFFTGPVDSILFGEVSCKMSCELAGVLRKVLYIDAGWHFP